MSKSVIQISNLSKRYRLGQKEKQTKTLVGQIATLIKSPWQNLKRINDLNRFGKEDDSVFWALKDVSFEVKEGEVLGIIGKNGAGKSTLLKVLSQITEPTSGKLEIRGRVASLLEVGTGFHPELSGRENIYMNGTILGMTRREIDTKLDEIIDFSGVEKFLDTPVKFYSSGMKVRLGFSVAAHLNPEILIIDEVLAVGDFEFQKKCLGKMEDVSRNQGRTVLFVSHNMAAVQNLCQSAILLNSGKVIAEGSLNEVVKIYLSQFDGVQPSNYWEITEPDLTKPLEFTQISISISGQQPHLVMDLNFKCISNFKHKEGFVAIDISSQDGTNIFQSISQPKSILEYNPHLGQFNIKLNLPPLVPGLYKLSLWAGSDYTETLDWKRNVLGFEVVESPIIGRTFPHSSFNNGFFCPESFISKIEL